jgi:hypothetical protein
MGYRIIERIKSNGDKKYVVQCKTWFTWVDLVYTQPMSGESFCEHDSIDIAMIFLNKEFEPKTISESVVFKK